MRDYMLEFLSGLFALLFITSIVFDAGGAYAYALLFLAIIFFMLRKEL